MRLVVVDDGTASVFGQPGTRTPAAVVPSTAKNFVVAGLLAGSVIGGTLTAVTPADAAALNLAAARARTLPAGPVRLEPALAQPVAEKLRRLRQVSGLSWGEIAAAVGVSRRAVHHWLSGSRMAGAHLTRVLALEGVVALHQGSDPQETREHLLRPSVAGRSVLDDSRLQLHTRRPSLRPSGSVSELLGPDEPAAEPAVGTATRPSELAGGGIPPRGQK